MSRHKVGETFELVKGPVSTTQLVMYAGASGDFNRIHYDLPFALEAGLGGVIAHGMLTMGFAAQMIAQWCGPECFVNDIGASFRSPVKTGDHVQLRGKVVEIDGSGPRATMRVEFEGHVGDRKVIVGDGVVQFPS